MKTKRKSERSNPEGYDSNVHIAPAPLTFLVAVVLALTVSARAETPPAAIPFSDIEAKATADYQGDALGITATSDGARLRCGFQKLEGRATPEGLWLESTDPGSAGKLRLTASALRRAGLSTINPQPSTVLAATGTVSVADKLVRFTRPGVTEEYSVSVDGVRQDFVIAVPPAGAGDLRVELALSGARAEAAAGGARLRLEGSGRELAYGRLRAEDATGRELTARLEVISADRLAVSVSDANAIYPVRIDPTFSDADWVSLNPGLPGANRDVWAIVADGSGNVYVGGRFTFIGTVPAIRIAKWDGSAWSALGSGINGWVRALAVSGTSLYAGGDFTAAGGVAATNIAKWDGSAWSALGLGMNSVVYALAVSGTDLYAGGDFTTAGGVAANRIAKWDGSVWSALGSGMSGVGQEYSSVHALAFSGTNLYAGGYFTTAGGVPAKYIAKWNGSAWSALGSGIGGSYPSVHALAVSGTSLYAGGDFTAVGGVAATNIAKWNGSAWSALGSGMGGPYRWVYALAVSGSDLYAGGEFTTAGGVPANNIAKWNGSAWSPLRSGMDGDVFALAVSGSDLYAGGYFTSAGGVAANSIAKWDGSAWSALGSGMNSGVRALAVSGTNLYAGGTYANNLAKWDGSAWSALGSGLGPYPRVYALAVSGTDLYTGGRFTTAGGVAATNIAKWNGNTWSALGSGMNLYGDVHALAVSGTDLYAGGDFTTAGGVQVNYVAKWNGSAWSALGSGMGGNYASVQALAVSGTNLYAGGSFTNAGGVPAYFIAKWNGSAWSALGSGMNNYVTALAVSGTNLYGGGQFTTAGGVTANWIAKWDGSTWSTLGSGMNNYVTALAVSGTNLYAGGRFTTAGSVVANYIAKWNGNAWSALGSGIGGLAEPAWSVTETNVYALAADGEGHLFVGGDFSLAGTNVSLYIAQANLGNSPPTILTQPASQRRVIGSAAYFSVSVDGSLPLSYQWFFNNTNALAGANNSFLELTNLQFSQAGYYTVQVTNAFGAVTSSPAMLDLVSATVVTTCTEADLRAAMAGGGIVMFDCNGTITLSNTITISVDTVLDGSGHQVTISGSNAVRVFYVKANVVFALANLTVANGGATNGAGLLNASGKVNITNCVFSGNRASAEGFAGPANSPHGPPGQDACGGALDNAGIINAVGCTFIGNSATGGRGGEAANVYQYGQFPGNGGSGGAGTGGAVHNTGLFVALGCTFSSNVATGGVGGDGSHVAIFTYSVPMNGGNGGSGGSGNGGAVFNRGAAHLINCSLALNAGSGAAGGWGGVGSQGAPGYPNGTHGADGSPGSGFGGIDDSSGQCQLINCTLAFNSGTGGSPKGGISTSGATMINTLLAGNTPGGNGSSAIVDLGHNLSSDNSCAFTNVGSLNNTNPKLGPLANNGGPTLTMALLPGSPAIDAGDDVSAPSTDQRGFPRPVGAAADVGAFEYGSPALLRISRSSETAVEIFVLGVKTQWCRLFTSTTLSDWRCVATNQIGANGTVLFQDNCGAGETQRFYRVALP